MGPLKSSARMHDALAVPDGGSARACTCRCSMGSELTLYILVLTSPRHPSMTRTRLCERSNTLHERGFTLVEMLVTIVVFGLLIGFSIPSYQSYALSQKLRGTSENLVQTIQLQRSRAMATGQNVTINFNTAAPAGWTVMSDGKS